MPVLRYGARALSDLDRLADFLIAHDPIAASRAIETILDGLTILQRHPLIGRPLEGTLRELVISWGEGGYVALYRFRPQLDRVEVLAVRHQREAGYR